ncbi:uncharacterized protein LOC142323661 isoform X2 [Lycorma delicatula]|uniref:uncharacterized protein LOC142323661 isoform X2 n=1 Tax=Lycorma delicatula TaxID=130591 RepID=UPI003F51A708
MSVLLESRSFRPFKSSEEYLYAMKEDLAEWLSNLYPELYINVENFMDRLDTGVALCKHANSVRKYAEEYVVRRQAQGKAQVSIAGSVLRLSPVRFLPGAKPGTFFARDNVSNFISWCRRGLGVFECLLFETDDLIMRKNEKHVILCLLEVARRGAKLGMPAPMLVQLEREIDREIAADKREMQRGLSGYGLDQQEEEDDLSDDEDVAQYGPLPQIVTNDLKSLDEMVRDLVERCKCPTQFPMIRVSEGKYRIGDTKVLIFVRVLRSHVMVRVGGGWDTLSHYLDKHDPCRCKTAHRAPVSAKVVGMRLGGPAVDLTHTQVHYERSPPRTRRSSASSIGSNGGGCSLAPYQRTRSRSPSSRHGFGGGSLDRERSISPGPTMTTLSPRRVSSVSGHRSSVDRSRSPSASPTPRRTRATAPSPGRYDSIDINPRNRSRSPTPRRDLRPSSRASSKHRSRSTTPMREPEPTVQPVTLNNSENSFKEELLRVSKERSASLTVPPEFNESSSGKQEHHTESWRTLGDDESGVDTSPAHKVSENLPNITRLSVSAPRRSPTPVTEITSGVDTTPSRKVSDNFELPDPQYVRRIVKYGSAAALDSLGSDPQTNNDSGSEVSDEGYRSLGIVNTTPVTTPASAPVTAPSNSLSAGNTPHGSPVRVPRPVRSRSVGGQDSQSSPSRRNAPANRSARHSHSHTPIMQQHGRNTWNSGSSRKQRPTISADTFCQQVADIMQQYAAMMPSPRKDSKPDSGVTTRIPAPVHRT